MTSENRSIPVMFKTLIKYFLKLILHFSLMISKDVRFWGISMFPFGLVRLQSHSGSVQYKLLYNTPLPSIRRSSRCYRTDVWSRTPAHKIKSLQEITVCSPHWILKGGNVLPVWWPAPTTQQQSTSVTSSHVFMVHTTLTWFGHALKIDEAFYESPF